MRLLQSIGDILKKPYVVFYSILLFFTPLVVVSNTNELYEFPKMFFVYFFGFFIIAFFASDVIINQIKIKLPSLSISVFFLLTLISTIFSSHIHTSFFGYYSRFNGGILSYLVFFGLYFVAINKLKKEDFDNLIKVVIFTIIPISIYGLSQYFGGTLRAFSTFGQPNWMAQYLAMLLPICIYILVIEDEKKYLIWFSIYVLGFYCLWVSYSSSGIFGFFAGLIFLLSGYLRRKKLSSNIQKRIVMVLAISFLISIANLGIFENKIKDIFTDLKRQTTLFKKSYAQEDADQLSDPGFIRFELWKSSINLIKSSPKIFLIGSGPETFPYAFQQFRNVKLNFSSEWDFVFNKPHNYFLEIWSDSGIFTLLTYLFILYVVIKKSPSYLGSSFLAFGVSNIFGWPVVPTSLLFWFFIAEMDISSPGIESFLGDIKEKIIFFSRTNTIRVFVSFSIWFLYFLLMSYLKNIYIADVSYKKSQDLVKEGKNEKALYYSDRAISLNPLEPTYYRGRAKINTSMLVYSTNTNVIKESIFVDLKKSQELNPENLVILRNSIPIYYFLGVGDIFQNPSFDNVDQKYIHEVTGFFESTKRKYWNDVGVILAVAKYEKRLELEDKYEDSVERIKKLRPDLLYWHELFR